MWNDPRSGDKIPMVIKELQPPIQSAGKKYKWAQYDYQELMKLAKLTRNRAFSRAGRIAPVAFLAWNKKAPIKFGNSAVRSLGFSHHDKTRALQALERAGWITVQWHKRKSPLVTIMRGLPYGL